MIYSNPNSKIVHARTCQYVQNKTHDLIAFFDMKITQRKGYRPCKKCNPVQKKWRKEKEAVLDFVRKQNVRLNYDYACLNVFCGNESWKIVIHPSGKGVALYHKNITADYTDNYVPYYHMQKVRCQSLIGLLRYIYDHYLYRQRNPIELVNPKKAPKLKKHKPRKQKREKNERLLDLIKSLHNEELYKDFLCYLT